MTTHREVPGSRLGSPISPLLMRRKLIYRQDKESVTLVDTNFEGFNGSCCSLDIKSNEVCF